MQETVDDLVVPYDEDVAAHSGPINRKESDLEILYPRYMKAAGQKALDYKESQDRGPRRLCLVPSFTLSLVMVSKIKKHWVHAPWFKVVELCRMLEKHGAVSRGQ